MGTFCREQKVTTTTTKLPPILPGAVADHRLLLGLQTALVKTLVIISSITLMEVLPLTLTQVIRGLWQHQSSSKHEDVMWSTGLREKLVHPLWGGSAGRY